MAVLYTPHFAQFEDANGLPLAGGKLYSYAAGTTTPKATYTTAAGDIENTNPVILDSAGRATIFLAGSYKFTLTDADDVLIKTTDNVTSFTAATSTDEGFFQLFSGDGLTTEFTLTDNLGQDEKALSVFAENEYSKNGSFASDADWTKGTGWSIGSGVATATGAISTALEQNAQISLIQGRSYSVQYTITRSAGSITLSLGGTAGTARSASGTYAETIIAGSTQSISFGTSGFTGTLDNVSIRDVTGPVNIPPTRYTVDGTALTFTTSPASGNNNIYVYAPYTLIGAAGAAQVAADDAIAAAAAAALSETAAETAADEAEAALFAIEGLRATSTTSLNIEVAEKTFTTQTGKGFIAGMWLLVTSDADPTNYFHGYVTSYTSATLVLEVVDIGGTGTFADWTIGLSGTRGAVGAAGSIGDIAGQDTATVAAGDFFVFADINDSNSTKKTALEDIPLSLLDGFIDDDTFATATATNIPSAESVKAYVDASITAQSAKLLHIQEHQSSGVSGTNIATGVETTVLLNTVLTNEISGSSLSSGVVTLPAGTYDFQGIVPARRGSTGVTGGQSFFDIDSGAQIIIGSTGRSDTAPDTTLNFFVSGRFTIASPKNVKMQARAFSNAFSAGTPVSFGTEVYSDLKIWKVL